MSRCLVAVLISWSATLGAQQPVPLAIPGVCGLAANAVDQRLYVATCIGGQFPNNQTSSIIAFDPATHTQVNSLILPSSSGIPFNDRNLVGPVLSSDGKHLYVARNDMNVIHRFGLPALNLELDIPVRVVGGTQTVFQLRAVPGQPTAIVVVTASYLGEGVAVYDDAVMRPQTLVDNTCQSVGFGATADVLYCFAWKNTGDYVLRTVRVDSSGLTVTRTMNTFAGSFGGPFVPFEVFGNRIYTAVGAVLDTDSLEQVGRLDFSLSRLAALNSSVEVDRENRRVFFSVDQTIWAYDLDRLVPTVQHAIFGSAASDGPPIAFARWGSDGFAVALSGRLILLQGSLKPYPEATFAVSQTASGALVLDGPATNLAHHRASNRIWASIPSKAGSRGNSIVQISPTTGQVEKVIPTASEPSRLAFTEDGQFLYVAFRCTPEIHRYNLQAQAFDQRIHLRQEAATDKPNIGLMASDFTIMPGTSSRLVVSRSIFPPHSAPSTLRISFQSLVVYDNGQPKPNGPFQELQIGILLPPESASKVYGIVVDPYGYSESIARLQVDSTGVSVVGNRVLDFRVAQFAVRNDVLYSSAGLALQFDSPERLGVFPNGISTSVALNSSGSQVYFFSVVDYPTSAAQSTITSFSTETFLPIATLDLVPTGPGGSTMIATPDDTFAVATEKKLFIVASRLLQPVPAYYAASQQVANGVARVQLAANSLAFDKSRGQLVASVSSVSPGTGNSIATIDPQTGAVRYSSFVGSEPTAVGVSDDGSVLHVSIAGELKLARFGYPALTHKTTIPFAGADLVNELHVAPGNPERIVTGVLFFDHLKKLEYVRLPNGVGGPNTGTFGKDASTFYGQGDNEGHWRIAVDANRAQELSHSALAVGHDNTYVYDGGLVYDASGLVIDPERARVIGKFEHPALVQQINASWTAWVRPLPDSASGRMYYVVTPSGGGQASILVFDLRTHAQLGELRIAQSSGGARDFLKCGADCLAFRTTHGDIFVVAASSIPLRAPSPVGDPTAQLRSTPGVYESSLLANDLVFDPSRRLLYASIPNSAGANGNHIAVIRPDTVEIIDWIPVPGEPFKLAIAKDATVLYVGLGQSNTSVVPIDLGTRKTGTTFPIVDAFSSGACAMEVVPNRPDALVVSKCGASLELYVHGNPVFSFPYSSPQSIEFLDAQTFAGFTNYAFPSSLGRYQVQGDRLVELGTARGLVSQNSSRDHFRANGNRLYFSTGDLVDAESLTVAGRLPATGWVQLDAARNRIHFLSPIGRGSTPSAAPAIRTLEISTGNLVNETLIPSSRLCGNPASVPGDPFCGDVKAFIRWSDTGFAFLAGAPLYGDPLRSKVVFADISGSGTIGPPVVASGGVVDAASFRADALVPGSIITVFGSRLSMPIAQASFVPLWTNLADTTVYVNGEPVPLYYVSPGQINAQLPVGLAPGTATLRVVSGSNVSAPVSITIRPMAPAVFAKPDGQVAALNQDGILNSPSSPAKPGTVLAVYCTGLGPTQPPVITGAASPFAPLAQAVASVAARIGGQPAEVLYAGMAPGFVGLGQVNVRVPALPPGSHVLEILTDGIPSKAVSVSVGQ